MKLKVQPRVQFIQTSVDWEPKMQGVVFVQRKEDIEKVWKLLCEQDDYWESYKKVIKVLPFDTIKSTRDLEVYCEYVGRTDIYDIDDFNEKCQKEGIDVFLFQYRENDCD